MRDALQSLIDGELPEAPRAALSKHLDECAGCAAALCRLQESDRLLSAARPEPAGLSPAASRALLERALTQAVGSRRTAWRAPFVSWQFAAALVVAAAGTGWWVYASPLTPGRTDASSAVTGHPQGVAGFGTVLEAATPGEELTSTGPATRKGIPPKRTPQSEKVAPSRKNPTSPTVVPPSETHPRPEQPPRRATPPRYRYAGAVHPRSANPALSDEDEAPAELAWACAARAEPPELPDEASPAVQVVSDPPAESAVASPAVEAPESQPPLLAPGSSAPGQLLVIVTDGPAAPRVRVTQAPEEAPGFARASAFCADPEGKWTWTQATVSRECAGPEQSLVTLSGDVWQWGEEDDHDGTGKQGDQGDNSEDGAAGGSAKCGDEPAGGPARVP